MRLKLAKEVHFESGPNMTPLVDVVMVILIFLMLAGSIGEARFIKSHTDICRYADRAGRDKPQDANIVVRIQSAGPVGFSATVNGEDPTSIPSTLTEKVIAKRDGFLSAGIEEDAIQVALAPDGGVKYQDCISAYAAVNAAKVNKFTWRVVP